jgi:hypothetical protein
VAENFSPREDLGGELFVVAAAAARSLRLNPRTIPPGLSLARGWKEGRAKKVDERGMETGVLGF